MLTSRKVCIKDLSRADVEVMFRLMNAYYDNLKRRTFEDDLNVKKGVLLVFDGLDRLCGFTTYDVFEVSYRNETLHILYSGDTIIEQKYWGHIETSRMFMSLLEDCLKEYGSGLYWFLITKGIRTYRLLPLFFQTYYPTYQILTPSCERELIAYLSAYKFHEQYNRDTGIIRLAEAGDCLKDEYVRLAPNKLENPHVRFFSDANPGYVSGDYLPCIAQISLDNFTDRALRFMGQSVGDPVQ